MSAGIRHDDERSKWRNEKKRLLRKSRHAEKEIDRWKEGGTGKRELYVRNSCASTFFNWLRRYAPYTSIIHPGLLSDPNRSEECQGETSSCSQGLRAWLFVRTGLGTVSCSPMIAVQRVLATMHNAFLRARVAVRPISRVASENHSRETIARPLLFFLPVFFSFFLSFSSLASTPKRMMRFLLGTRAGGKENNLGWNGIFFIAKNTHFFFFL